MKIDELSEHVCQLGEGPLWDAGQEKLYWVDSLGPRLFRHDYHSGKVKSWLLPGDCLGSLAVRESGGLILAMDQGIYAFDTDSGAIEPVAIPLADTPWLRFNDGKVDPFGNFITGAMNLDFREMRNCAMYRLSPDLEVQQLLQGFHCFNGPCFTEGGDRLYVTGRVEGLIEVFDYSNEQGVGSGRNLLADCNPDGATVDAEGYIWSAQWDDACLLRIAPDGVVDTRIDFPGQIVSSVMFGGPDLDRIYVTTTSSEVCGVLPSAKRAGRVLVVSGSGFRGRPEPRFAG